MAEGSYPTSEVRGGGRESRLQRRRNGREELPKSEVRGGGQEMLPCVRGQGRGPRGATPRPRSGEARISYLVPEARGGGPEESPRARVQGRQPGGATPAGGQGQRLRPGVGREEQLEERWVRGRRGA